MTATASKLPQVTRILRRQGPDSPSAIRMIINSPADILRIKVTKVNSRSIASRKKAPAIAASDQYHPISEVHDDDKKKQLVSYISLPKNNVEEAQNEESTDKQQQEHQQPDVPMYRQIKSKYHHFSQLSSSVKPVNFPVSVDPSQMDHEVLSNINSEGPSTTDIDKKRSSETGSQYKTSALRCGFCPCSSLCLILSSMALLFLTGTAIAAGILFTHTNKPITTDSSGASSGITVTTTIATSNTSLNTMITSSNITVSSTLINITTTNLGTSAMNTTTIFAPSSILNNTCTASMNHPVILLYISNASTFSYQFYQYSFVATTTNSTMTFALRQDPNFWYLDDISVFGNGQQMWNNGGFETGLLNPYYTICNPYLASASGTLSSTNPHSGSYNYMDGSVGYSDYLFQSFTTVVGVNYNISFWLSNAGGTPNSATVIISS